MPFKDPEAQRAYFKAYDLARKEKRAVDWRRRYALNPDTFKAYQVAYRAKNREALKVKRQLDRERDRERSARKRALKRKSYVEPISFAAILRAANGVCGICRKPFDLFGIDFDHIIPLARGGPHIASNIQATHARCNRAKGAKVG